MTLEPDLPSDEAIPGSPGLLRGRATLGLAAIGALIERIVPRGAIVLSILTFASYAMGLLRDRIFARTFGASAELDAYNAAFVLPELTLDVLVAGGLAAPFIPIFLQLRDEDAAAAERFGQTVLTGAVLVMAGAAAIMFVFAEQTTGFIAPGFGAEQRALYVGLFRLMLLTPIIFAASIALGEVLVAERRFLAYGLAPLLYNVGIIGGTVLLAARMGIYAAAIGAVAGASLHLAIRLWGIRGASFRPRPRFTFRTRAMREFLRLMLPKMASHPIEPLTFLYFTALASTLAAGSVSALSFARNFQSVPVSLIGISFSLAAFPALASAFVAGDRRRFGRLVAVNAATITILTGAAAVVLYLVGGLVIRLFLGGGAFDEEDVQLTTLVLSVFALSIPFESLVHLLSRAIYATRNTMLPVLAAVAGFVLTVALGGALTPTMGIAAIPLAFTVGMIVRTALLGIALVPRLRRVGAAPTALAEGSSGPPR